MGKQILKIINSRMLYYVAIILMIVNVLGYVSQGSIECLFIFAISYFILCSKSGIPKKYSKLPSLSIFGGLFISNVIFGCGKVKEGMTAKPTNELESAQQSALEMDKEIKRKCEAEKGVWTNGKCVTE
jgi:hypothetical protein